MLKGKNYLQPNNLQAKSFGASGNEGQMEEKVVLVAN